MRHLLCLLLGLLLCPAVASRADAAPRLNIDQIRIGFTAERDMFTAEKDMTRFKMGAWTPVRIDVTNGPEVISHQDYVVVTETIDGDEMPYQFPESRGLPTLQPNEQITLMTFVKPGGNISEITITIRSRDGKTTYATAKARRENMEDLPPDSYLCLAVGSRLEGLRRAVNKKPGNLNAGIDDDELLDNESLTKVANAETVDQLPTHWFGYAGVDLVILTSGSERFISELAADRSGRKEALAEWVRRGGRLIVSVGGNHQYVNNLITGLDLLKCPIEGSISKPQLVLESNSESLPRDPGLLQDKPNRGKAAQPVALALLKPRSGVDVLMSAKSSSVPSEKWPVIVQSGCGAGRVLLVAFDLDLPPFTNWEAQDKFWTALCQDFGLRLAAPNVQSSSKGSSAIIEKKELAGLLADDLDAFQEVPVVSFGWVALFIVIYIIVVGPLDYLFLKKVVKRLEWTWITFPTVVLAVSAGAYFLAYYLKGNDLRINKIDIVDIDLEQSKAYGSSWFTIFSPRIQNYTVGIEPNTKPWTGPPGGQPNPFSLVVESFDRPETPMGGRYRSGSQSLFGRTYRYAADATGLEGVPLQVWSTKSFDGSWQAAAPPKLLEVNLTASPTGDGLTGTIKSNLPVSLQDAVLIYRGEVYEVGSTGKLSSGEQVQLTEAKKRKLEQWVSNEFARIGIKSQGSAKKSGSGPSGGVDGLPMKSILFFNPSARTLYSNSGLRFLDQVWRTRPDHKQEAVLVGRTAPSEGVGLAEKISQEAVSPSQLWLGQLPAPGAKRPDLAGAMSQETYIRVFVPVKQ